ncbi:unnamed protein product [Coffea canephora]|uniref:Uncharacterized protein n=1 Tax=Coffea canephora TaxID=49390 RepID=A0A068UBN2_COFCA|nr:unnamed protein product [Coffea canephora]
MIISSLTESRRKLVVAVEHNTNETFMFNGGLCGVPRYLVPPCSTSIDHKSSTKKIAHVIFLTLGITAALLAMISYFDLLQATESYGESHVLETGSTCGSVYRLILKDGMLVAVKESMAYTKILATFGYIAPEYGLEGIVSTQCDAYPSQLISFFSFCILNFNFR